jgi:hypothetical protein
VTDAVPDAVLEVVAETVTEREAAAETEAAAEADDIALADKLAITVGRELALALKFAAVGEAVCTIFMLGVGAALVEGGVLGSGGAVLGANARKVVVLRARQGSLSKAKLASAASDMAST